jgi:hypothetical protein
MKPRLLAGIATLAVLAAAPAHADRADDCENIRLALNNQIAAYNHLREVVAAISPDNPYEDPQANALELQNEALKIRMGREDYHRCVRGE